MEYEFITDPGHGWLKVPLADLNEFGVVHEITRHSYMTATHAYLEEDCDAPTFLKAAGLGNGSGIPNCHTEGEARCRGYRSYDAVFVERHY